MDIAERVATILGMLAGAKGATFASFVYTNAQGETSRYVLVLNATTRGVYEKDIAALEFIRPSLTGIDAIACDEILASRRQSLEKGIGNNDAYTNADTYVFLPGFDNVKIHKDTGDIHITGLQQSKQVITAGEPRKPVKSSDKTLAKKRIMREVCRGDDFRQFKLANISKVTMRGEVVEFE